MESGPCIWYPSKAANTDNKKHIKIYMEEIFNFLQKDIKDQDK